MQSKKENEFMSGQVEDFFAIGQSTEKKVFSRVASNMFATSKLVTEY